MRGPGIALLGTLDDSRPDEGLRVASGMRSNRSYGRRRRAPRQAPFRETAPRGSAKPRLAARIAVDTNPARSTLHRPQPLVRLPGKERPHAARRSPGPRGPRSGPLPAVPRVLRARRAQAALVAAR